MLKERYLHLLNTDALENQSFNSVLSGTPALLILDMQNYFLSPESHAFVPSAPDLIPVLSDLADTFEARDLPVVFTRHINTAENAGMMDVWWRDRISMENPLHRINSAFDTSWGGVITKTQYDAFYNTQLHELLTQLGVTSVVITGVMTHLCCETTARSAFVHGYQVLMPIDGTATVNREMHRATTANLSHGFCRTSCVKAVSKAICNAY